MKILFFIIGIILALIGGYWIYLIFKEKKPKSQAIIGAIIALLGLFFSLISLFYPFIKDEPDESDNQKTGDYTKAEGSGHIVVGSGNVNINTELATEPEPYKIYLYLDYIKPITLQNVDVTATLNFDADSVDITAYLESGKTDTLTMVRKNSTEWTLKVDFYEAGTHSIIATATSPDGDVIESSPITVEVSSIDVSSVFEQIDWE